MTTFKKKKINSEIITIIDIGSYKIKVAICKFSSSNIKLLSFAEKRQSYIDIVNNEIKNLEGICENINLAIKKAEKKLGFKVKKIVINPSFSNIFFYSRKITHIRQNPYKLIDEKELKKIIEEIENISYFSATKKIENDFLYPYTDLEIIISNISEIKIDRKIIKNPIQENGEKISFYLLNIFLSQNNIELLNYISKFLKKDLIKILPEEFCFFKIVEKKKKAVILDIGNNTTRITIKNNNNIFGSIKINVGINTLIENIRKQNNFSRAEIIKKINREDLFIEEKEEFLKIFLFLISEHIKEIMGDTVVPNNFLIIGGGANEFLIQYIKNYDFSKNLKINKKIKLIDPDISEIGRIENIEEIINKSTLNLIAMILTYDTILKQSKDIVEIFLKESIKKITT